MQKKVPGFELRLKGTRYPNDPWYRKIIEKTAKIFCPTYESDFATTMYPYVYVPVMWLHDPRNLYETLRHEYIHLRDSKKYGPLFQLSYIAVLPAILTMRAFWERRGFAQNLIYNVEQDGKVGEDTIQWMLPLFTGISYAWMDPFAESKIRQLADKANRKEIKGLWPYDEGDFEIP